MENKYRTSCLILIVFFFSVNIKSVYTQEWILQNSVNSELNDIHFIDENTGWVVGNDRTLLKTTDGGENWTPIAIPFGSPEVPLNNVFFIDQNVGWISSNVNYFTSDDDNFLIKTIDGGNSWSQVQGLPLSSTERITDIQFINNNTGWLSINYDIYKTVNGGQNWNIVCDRCSQGSQIFSDIHFSNPLNGWAVTLTNEMVRSTDGGNTWSLLPDNEFTFQSLTSKIHFSDATTGWFVIGSISEGTVGKTTNGGNSWSAQGFPSGMLDGDIFFVNNDKDYGWVVGKNVYQTSDGGTTWQLQSTTVSGAKKVYGVSKTKAWILTNWGGNGGIWGFECNIPPTSIDTVICPEESFFAADIEHTDSGHYEYSLRGRYGCDSLIILDLTVLPKEAVAGEDLSVCQSEAQLQATTPDFPMVTGTWRTSLPTAFILFPNNANTKVEKLTTGKNTFIWTLSHPNCPEYDQDTVQITYPFLPEADAGSDFTVCGPVVQLDALPNAAPITGRWTIEPSGPTFSDPTDAFSTLTDLVPGSDHKLSWTLSHPDCPDYSNDNLMIYYDDSKIEAKNDRYTYTSGTLRVNITDNDLFPDPEAIEVTIVDQSLNPDVGQLEVNPAGDLTFSADSTFAFSRVFRYRITHRDCPELSSEANVFISLTGQEKGTALQEISLVFTPDGDGINDTFIIPELLESPEEFPDNSLVVINRWGEVVYQAEPYNNDWDGRHYKTGTTLPVGTYFFIARLKLADGIIQQGKATLVR